MKQPIGTGQQKSHGTVAFLLLYHFDMRPHGYHGIERIQAVFAAQEVVNVGGTVCQTGQNGSSVRYAFIAGNG